MKFSEFILYALLVLSFVAIIFLILCGFHVFDTVIGRYNFEATAVNTYKDGFNNYYLYFVKGTASGYARITSFEVFENIRINEPITIQLITIDSLLFGTYTIYKVV